ncbi:EF-hand domain-containing protein [Streptomyces sp. NPDC054796]
MQTRTAVIATALAAAGVLGATGSALAETSHASAPPTFHQMDTNKSGTISEPELRTAAQAQGVSRADVHKAFGMVDTNSDGQISKQEFVKGSRKG